ncbi:MAG TPA: hypothetical protein VF493_13295 [Terriglobales bacterium]
MSVSSNVWFRRFGLLLLACGLVFGQTAPGSQSKSDPAKENQHSGDIGINVEQNPSSQKKAPERKISPEEAKALFASVDEIFKFASEDTGFVIKHPVKRELASRDVVQKYVESRLSDDEDAKRLERSEIVLKKFGLLPRDFDLHTFLVGLLREQVAGYYDVRSKTIFLLDWLDADAQQPVLAHELTHALQDQNYDLKKWSSPGDDHPKPDKKDDRFDYDEDEESMARNAVAEGQAMVTLIDYMLRPTGHSLADSPQFGKVMRDAMGNATDSPMLERAPLMLRESLLYPYRDGLDFEQELLTAGGRPLAFNGAFKQPPQNTHQILDPADYLKRAPILPLPIPDLRSTLGKSYEKYDVGSVGQFDVSVIMKQYSDDAAAAKLASSWRGGSYYAARKSSNSNAAIATGDLALLYLSRWDSDKAAEQFANVYREGLTKRYKQAGKPQCLPADTCDRTLVSTEEGPVIIEHLANSTILITEGFEPLLQQQLKARLQSDSDKRAARRDLILPFTRCALLQDAMKNAVLKSLLRVSRQLTAR